MDIHCGGVDNIFPHHTNEIAQSESYLGHKWCNYWVHSEHLNDETGKMSKSKGEFLTVSLLEEKGYSPLVYRLFCLNSHYRKTLVFNYQGMEQNKIVYDKLLRKISSIKNNIEGELQSEQFENYHNAFKEALENDLNTSNALTVLFDVVKDESLTNTTKLKLIESFDTVLSLGLLDYNDSKEIDAELEQYILEMIEKRKEAKTNRDFALADQIRAELLEKGIVLKDTREGTTYEIV